jgi:hypothetical protein
LDHEYQQFFRVEKGLFSRAASTHPQLATSGAATGPTTVVAAGAGGWISTVGGGTPTTANCSAPPSSPSGWTELDSPNNPIHEDFHVLVYDTAAASTGENTLYAGTDGGLFVSYDDGTTWTGSHNASPVMNSLGVSVLGDTILSGAWDVGVHWSFDHGATWQNSQNIDNDSTAVLATPSGWFAARLVCQSGVCIWQSAAQGASWSAKLQAVPPNVTFVELDGNVFTGGNADGNGNGLDVVYELGDASGNPGQYGPAFPDPNDVDTSVTAVDYQGSTYVIAGNQCAWAVNREYPRPPLLLEYGDCFRGRHFSRLRAHLLSEDLFRDAGTAPSAPCAWGGVHVLDSLLRGANRADRGRPRSGSPALGLCRRVSRRRRSPKGIADKGMCKNQPF